MRIEPLSAIATALANEVAVPLISHARLLVGRLTSGGVLAEVLGGAIAVVLALLLFRRLLRGWLILLALVLSAWLAWIALPWTSGAVAKIYVLLPPVPPVAPSSAPGAGPKSGLAHLLSRLLQNPPDPQAVAYATVFVVAFIALSILLRGALKRLERPASA